MCVCVCEREREEGVKRDRDRSRVRERERAKTVYLASYSNLSSYVRILLSSSCLTVRLYLEIT